MRFDKLDTSKMHGVDMSNVLRRDKPSVIWAYVSDSLTNIFTVFGIRAKRAFAITPTKLKNLSFGGCEMCKKLPFTENK